MKQNGLVANGAVSSALLLLALYSYASSCAGERARKYRPSRTEYGQVDIQGIWNFNSNVPLERPAKFADREYISREESIRQEKDREEQIDKFLRIGVGAYDKLWLDYDSQVENLRTSLITYPRNGRLPSLVEGVQRVPGSLFEDVAGTHPVRFFSGGIGKAGPEDRGLLERCIANDIGPPIMPVLESNYLQIVQTRDHVLIFFEQIHDARIVALDSTYRQSEPLRSWFGHSRGHWEGDTLVIETENFNDLTPSFDAIGSARNKKVTERFTRTSERVLQYSARLVDSSTFLDRIELTFPMAKVEHQLFEYACHEGNYSMATILSGESVKDEKRTDTTPSR